MTTSSTLADLFYHCVIPRATVPGSSHSGLKCHSYGRRNMFVQISDVQQIKIGAVLYLLVMFPIIWGFHKEVMWTWLYNEKTVQRWYRLWTDNNHYQAYARIRFVLVWLIIVPLEIITAPALYFVLRKHRCIRKAEQEGELKQQQANEKWHQTEYLIQQNQLMLNGWCRENSGKLKLYINTMHGVTAVMLPEWYEQSMREMKQQGKSFFPPTHVYVFADRRGNTEISRAQRLTGRPVVTYPSVSALYEFAHEYGIELVTDNKVFVPVTYPSGVAVFISYFLPLRSWQEDLVEAQMPKGLRPKWN
jgi:hypothetical protein